MGIPVKVTPYLTKTKFVKRTWQERLFTKPWHPFRKYNQITIPDNNIYLVHNQYICHPVTFEILKAKLNGST